MDVESLIKALFVCLFVCMFVCLSLGLSTLCFLFVVCLLCTLCMWCLACLSFCFLFTYLPTYVPFFFLSVCLFPVCLSVRLGKSVCRSLFSRSHTVGDMDKQSGHLGRRHKGKCGGKERPSSSRDLCIHQVNTAIQIWGCCSCVIKLAGKTCASVITCASYTSKCFLKWLSEHFPRKLVY